MASDQGQEKEKAKGQWFNYFSPVCGAKLDCSFASYDQYRSWVENTECEAMENASQKNSWKEKACPQDSKG